MAEKYYGKYRGIVTAVDNSEGMWKVRAKVPKLLDGFNTGWALPCLNFAFGGAKAGWGIEKGDMVWIEFEGGNLDYPIWTGGWFKKGEAPAYSGIMINGTLVEWQEDGIYIHGKLSVEGLVTCPNAKVSNKLTTKDLSSSGEVSGKKATIEEIATDKAVISDIDFANHVHGGIMSGGGTTGKPQ